MLLVVDAGNTNITFGVYNGEKLETTFRITTKRNRTADEFGMDICGLVSMAGLDWHDIDTAVIASVVPDIMHSLTQSIKGYMKAEIINIDYRTNTGIKVAIPSPAEMGPDRIADAAAAYSIYGGPVLIVDFGTATTYDVVNEKGELFTGITSPGINSCAKALYGEAAMLPAFQIRKPESIIAKDTISSLQAGLVYGYIGSVEYIINQVKRETGWSDLKVVATGGLGKIIVKETNAIDVFDMGLTLKGLKIIYEINTKK